MRVPSALHAAQAAQYLKQTGHVNTYTFTKMLTEMAIAEFHSSSFPVAIVRPSIVVSTLCPTCLPLVPARDEVCIAVFISTTTHAKPASNSSGPGTAACLALAAAPFLPTRNSRYCPKGLPVMFAGR